jgi:O-antigen/teichoic acid export membrane protein
VTLRGLGPGGKDHAEAEVSTRSRVLHCSWWQVLVKVLRKLPGTGWALLDQCVVSAANFLTIYLFARYLGTSEFGIFALAHTGLLLLTSMQNALLVQPHNVLGAGLPQAEYRRFTSALLLAQVIFCVAVCVALGAAGLLVSGLGSSRAGSVLIALAVSAAPWMGQEFVRRVLYTRGESRSAAINDTMTYGLQLLGAVVLVSLWQDRPEFALLVLGGSSLVGALFGLWQLRNHLRLEWSGGCGGYTRTWKEAWGFGKWLMAQNTVTWFGAQGHSWVVAMLLGAEQLGLYRATTHLVNVMNPLLQTAYSYLPSRGSLAYHKDGRSGLSRWVTRAAWLAPVAVMPFCIVLIGFPGEVLSLAYGEKYARPDLALILMLATVAPCLVFLKFPFDVGLLALHSTRSIFYVYLIPVVLLLTSGTALIHFYGILGVPMSSIVISSTLLLATYTAYRRALRRSREHAGQSQSKSVAT